MNVRNLSEVLNRKSNNNIHGAYDGELTWDMLVKEEPELKELLKRAKAINDNKAKDSFCANYIWYRKGFRESVYKLVGWEAKKGMADFMYTTTAFDIAYDKIYDALPDCRNCICL